MSRITIASSERSVAIIVEKFKYLKHKAYKNGNILWRCAERRKKCPSTVVTDTEMKIIVRIASSHNHDARGERNIDNECEQRENFTGWAIKTYSGGFKTKTVTREKYRRIVDTIKGEIRNSAENSKFRFWMRSKGFRLVGDQLFVLSTGGFDYKKVAVVEDFFDIIYSVHVEKGAKNGYHAGQKRTYRAVTERYAFLPREAVTKFLLGCAECQKRHDPDSTPVSSRHAHVQDYLPINLTTRNCVITLSAPDFRSSAHPTGTEWENWSSPKKRRLEDSSGSEIISPISTDEEIPPVLLKQEMRVSPEIDVQEEMNGKNGSEMKPETEEAWNFGVKKSSTPQRELSSPLQETSSVHDETSSSGNKDDDDDDDDDDLKAPHHDSERLKAFNMFVRLFVDENLDRCVPISKQPKEKVQAIIDSCTRQFPEYGERARKRIRTYLKSCRRNKRSRDSTSWPEPGRPTPAHLTSVQAEQILAAACENESHNAKRMRLGLEPVSQPMPSFAESRPQIVDFGPANLIENKANNNNNNNNNNKPGSPNYTKPELQSKSINTTNVGSLNQGFPGLAQYRSLYMNQNQFASPLLTGFHTSSSSPEDLSVRGPSSAAAAAAQTRNFLAQKLSPAEISAVRQLIAGYRESAAFLLRSADELQALLGHHQI